MKKSNLLKSIPKEVEIRNACQLRIFFYLLSLVFNSMEVTRDYISIKKTLYLKVVNPWHLIKASFYLLSRHTTGFYYKITDITVAYQNTHKLVFWKTVLYKVLTFKFSLYSRHDLPFAKLAVMSTGPNITY